MNALDAINQTEVPVLIVHGLEDEVGHSGHNNIFRSSESMDYINAINIEYRKLYDFHDQDIPYEVHKDFYKRIDRFLAQDINSELMEEIHVFFLENVDRLNP